MRVYESTEETLNEWEKQLSARYGNEYYRGCTDRETIERWSRHLSNTFGRQFELHSDNYATLVEWSKLIY